MPLHVIDDTGTPEDESIDLCTLAGVRARMQKAASDTSQDALVKQYIPQVAEEIMGWAEREFAGPKDNIARVFELERGRELLTLAPFDLRSVTKVVIDSDQGAGYTLSTDEYRLWPKPSRYGVYTALRLRPLSAALGRVQYDVREVTITGNWGFSAVPDDVVAAAELTVAHWLTANTGGFPSEDPSAPSETTRRALPAEACALLKRFKRVAV